MLFCGLLLYCIVLYCTVLYCIVLSCIVVFAVNNNNNNDRIVSIQTIAVDRFKEIRGTKKELNQPSTGEDCR